MNDTCATERPLVFQACRFAVLAALVTGFLAVVSACAGQPPPPPAPRVERFEREYPVNEAYQILSDRVIQNDKEAIASGSGTISSSYGTRQRTWRLSGDITGFPVFTAPGAPLYEALYNLALEEAMENIRSDGAFMAGKKWNGVWTRDISYAIQLSLAHILPDASRTSLMAKVNEFGEIIQDTGTGGSWPVSTDRLVWAIAAWELYLAEGDPLWLATALPILERSLERDRVNAIDPQTGLLFGETSFLDWREQTYPAWMEPRDIFESKALSTNLLHARALEIAGLMNRELGNAGAAQAWIEESARQYRLIQEHFPLESGLYSLYLYPPVQGNLPVQKTGTLGNSLAVLFQDGEAAQAGGLAPVAISAALPVVHFGIPTISPQQPGIPPYHNNGIWPFVEAYFGLAAAREGNLAAYSHSLNAMSRSAALFLSHMENMVYDTGHSSGTQINSERQLWSVAGYIAMITRGLFGINPEQEGIRLRPLVPELPVSGPLRLDSYRLRSMSLNIRVNGYGDRVSRLVVDGREEDPDRLIPWQSGEVNVEIFMEPDSAGSVNLIPPGITAPMEPRLTPVAAGSAAAAGSTGSAAAAGAAGSTAGDAPEAELEYRLLNSDSRALIWDGRSFRDPRSAPGPERGSIWSLAALRETEGGPLWSNLGPWFIPPGSAEGPLYFPLPGEAAVDLLPEAGSFVEVEVLVPRTGRYHLSWHYANGFGPINTDNKAAIRSMSLNSRLIGSVVFPQRGEAAWSDTGYSSSHILELEEGEQLLRLDYRPENRNMNGAINSAKVFGLQLIPLD